MGQGQTAYDEFVMDHIKNARNYRVLENADHELPAVNPMCGDRMAVQISIARGCVEDAAFQCECCGISMASASMMTEWVRGRSLEEAVRYARDLVERLADHGDAVPGENSDMERALFAIVREYPSRARCAALPWRALEGM
jgi:nitrogen fixation protein NifU and related proteins